MSKFSSSESGALASQQIEKLLSSGEIVTQQPLDQDQIQPASIDLRLGATAYRVRSSFLPGRQRTVSQCLQESVMHEIDLTQGAVLEKSCVYIVPLLESLNLPASLSAGGNPKSSTGRLDVFTRLITDYAIEFEQVPAGYSGPLYAEIAPLTFSVLVRKGSRLSQLRIRAGEPNLDDAAHLQLQQQFSLVDSKLEARDIKNGMPISVDLKGAGEGSLIGYRAKRHSGVVDVDKRAGLEAKHFWEPLFAQNRQLILDPGEFYILVSKQAVHVPLDFAAEMVPYDALVGEFRVHYAGFFDPGFGAPEAGGAGAKAGTRSTIV